MFSYLTGYKAGATVLQNEVKRFGWARAKGMLKCRIAWYVQIPYPMRDPFTQGFVDSQLDSTN
jgi:hypothetical protein